MLAVSTIASTADDLEKALTGKDAYLSSPATPHGNSLDHI
jgi:hypothetical protein